MKKPLLISLTALAVLGVTTATTLYAQTTTGSSVIARMKAAAAAFTLSADLNPGQTGYESAPVSGKKTGNMLTAGEWNRMLELVSQGGIGGGSGTGSPAFYYCTNAQSLDSTNVPCYGASRNQGLGDGRYRVVSCHIKGSTGHESINSQLLNFGRTGLAGMQDKWNSLYTDSQWQLCIEGSVLVVDTQSSSSGSSSSSPSNLVYINPDNTNFAPLACTPGVNYMINPIAFSATSATAYTTQKVAVLSAGNWRVKGTGFLRNRNIDSGRNHILRASTVIDGTTTHIYTNSVDTGIYGSRFDETVSVPTGKTAEILIGVQNMSLYGGNIVAWCTN